MPTPFLVGNLTWKGGQGGISWAPDPESEDPGGGTDATAGARAALGWYQRQYTGSDGGNIPRLTFKSAPVERLVLLNASRFIELDLYLLSTECRQNSRYIEFDVEVWVGDRFLAGQVHGIYDEDYWYYNKPYFSDGHCIHRARMAPELDRLVPGDMVRIEILLVGQVTAFQFGTKDTHASVIRFPHYTDEEAAERVLGMQPPETDPLEEPATPAPQRAAAPEPSGLVPIVGLGLLLLPRRRARPAALLAAALLMGGLAGCLGGDDAKETSSSPSVGLDYENPENSTIDVASGRGAVLGVVYDALDARIKLGGVHVSLLGTSNTSKSDAKGGFLLPDLPPRKYTIRFDRESYISQEIPIEVRKDTVTKLRVPMRLIEDRGAGFRPHGHDEWVGAEMPFLEQDVAMDQYVGLTTGQKGGVCANVYPISEEWCSQVFYPKDDRLVRPGTREIEVRIDWNPGANRVERAGLLFTDNRGWHWNETALYPRARNVPFTIQVGWEMADQGHQTFSTWGFTLIIPNNGGSYTTPIVSANQLVTEPFHVTMKIRKGVVPLEPAHRDFWQGNVTYEVGKNLLGWSTNYIGGNRDGHVYDHETRWDYIERLVPPETTWLYAMVDQGKVPSRPNPQAPLFYKPANVSPHAGSSTTYEWKKAVPVASSGSKLEYKFPISDKESDAFYQPRSNWWFMFNQDVSEASNVLDSTTERLTVVAHRDAFN